MSQWETMFQKPRWMTPEEWPPEDLWPRHTPAHTGTCTRMQMYTRTVIFQAHIMKPWCEASEDVSGGWERTAVNRPESFTLCSWEARWQGQVKQQRPEWADFNGNMANSILDTDPLKVTLLRRKLDMINWGLMNWRLLWDCFPNSQ